MLEKGPAIPQQILCPHSLSIAENLDFRHSYAYNYMYRADHAWIQDYNDGTYCECTTNYRFIHVSFMDIKQLWASPKFLSSTLSTNFNLSRRTLQWETYEYIAHRVLSNCTEYSRGLKTWLIASASLCGYTMKFHLMRNNGPFICMPLLLWMPHH